MRTLIVALTLASLTPSISGSRAQPPPPLSPTDPTGVIATIPCQLLTRPYFEGKPTAQWIPFYDVRGYVRGAPDWRMQAAPYGVPYRQWTNAAFAALKARGRECNPRPEDGYTLRLLLDAITHQQAETVGYNETVLVRRGQDEGRRATVLAELSAIEGLSDAGEQIQRLRRLQSLARTMPDLADQVGVAMDTAMVRQDRQREEAVRLERMQQAQRQLAAERDAVQRQELEAQQRREALDRARASRLAMEQETQAAAQAAEQLEVEARRRAEAERAALADRSAQARQAMAAQQQAEAKEASSAQAASDRAAQVMLQRDAARRAQADDAARQRATEQQADAPRRQAAVAQAVAAQQRTIGQLGIPERYLNGRVMMRDQTLHYVPGVTLRDYLAVSLQFGFSLSGGEARSGRHVVVRSKLPGNPMRSDVWRLDGDELYLAGSGEGDTIADLADRDRPTAERFLEVGYTLMLNKLLETSSTR